MSIGNDLSALLRGSGDRLVGAVAYWHTEGFSVPRAEVRAAFEAMGLGDAVGRDPRAGKLLDKASRRVPRSMGVTFKRLSDTSLALVVSREESAVSATTLEASGDTVVSKAQRLKLDHALTVRLGVSGGLEFVMPMARETLGQTEMDTLKAAASVLVSKYNEAVACMDGAEVSEILIELLVGSKRDVGLGAVSLRDGVGGIYFVPGASVPKLRQVAQWIESQSQSHVSMLEVYGSDGNLAEAARAARASFGATLADIQAELSEFVAECRGKGVKPSERNLGVRLEHLTKLNRRVAMWDEMLGASRTELEAMLVAARAEMTAALTSEFGL